MAVAELQNVTKRYGPVQALRGVNLAVEPGQLVALLGPNGAGKTTAVKLLLGLLAPTSGQATVFGQDPRQRKSRVRTGAMLQVARVPESLKVSEHIDLFASYYPSPLRLEETIAAAGLDGLENRLFGELSGGQRQRVLFALAICGNPDLLFLDEPTAGLDVEARRTLWGYIRAFVARGGSVLLTTHYLEEADALAERIIVINQGLIAAEGTPSEIKARTAGKKVRCLTRLDLASIRGIPGVSGVAEDKQGTEILTSAPERVLRELLSRDPSVSNLEVISSGLEEAFLAITQADRKTVQEEVVS
jgi:ABC-2 type transport system ATP-binding protein